MTTTFRHRPAVQYLEVWVDLADDPTLNWAWDVVQGVVGVYAGLSDDDASVQWGDWFDAATLDGAVAHHGIQGCLQEFQNACPADRVADHIRIMEEAARIGRGLPPHEATAPSRPTRGRKAAGPGRAVLRLVVDNTVR